MPARQSKDEALICTRGFAGYAARLPVAAAASNSFRPIRSNRNGPLF
ncbi:hypothetical protein EKH55_2514 [Sinorhizobium alkalisoli]|nr:hypothetical protein EKH55_2514 [Sinorhizobium alkalisoli]